MPIPVPLDAPSQLKSLVAQKGAKQKSRAWLDARRNILTCSDIAAVLGDNPYSTRQDVMNKKLGIGPPFKGNIFTRWGNEHEDEAIERFEQITGKSCVDVDFGLRVHPALKFIGGSPDGITTDLCLIEIKCPYRRKIIAGKMPLYYKAQVLVLMEVFNLRKAFYMEYRPGNLIRDEVVNIIEIERSPVWFAAQLPKMRAFVEELTAQRIAIESSPGYVRTESESDTEEREPITMFGRAKNVHFRGVCRIVENVETM